MILNHDENLHIAFILMSYFVQTQFIEKRQYLAIDCINIINTK